MKRILPKSVMLTTRTPTPPISLQLSVIPYVRDAKQGRLVCTTDHCCDFQIVAEGTWPLSLLLKHCPVVSACVIITSDFPRVDFGFRKNLIDEFPNDVQNLIFFQSCRLTDINVFHELIYYSVCSKYEIISSPLSASLRRFGNFMSKINIRQYLIAVYYPELPETAWAHLSTARPILFHFTISLLWVDLGSSGRHFLLTAVQDRLQKNGSVKTSASRRSLTKMQNKVDRAEVPAVHHSSHMKLLSTRCQLVQTVFCLRYSMKTSSRQPTRPILATLINKFHQLFSQKPCKHLQFQIWYHCQPHHRSAVKVSAKRSKLLFPFYNLAVCKKNGLSKCW